MAYRLGDRGGRVFVKELSVTTFAALRLVRLFVPRIGKKLLENKLYLLIQRPVLMFGESGKPVFESLRNSEQQRNSAFRHGFAQTPRSPFYRAISM
jgi:hypothetical protein